MNQERVLLVGGDIDEGDFDQAMEELESLAQACAMETVGRITQKLPQAYKGYFFGSGKVAEIKEFAGQIEADLVLFYNALSPSQLRNLQKEIGRPVMDRTALILEIFASRARTREAKLQVEMAQLQYLLPRLVGMHEALGRQGGGSGLSNKGAGEKKLELDRRRIEHRISELRKDLQDVEKERATQRKKRSEAGLPLIALTGYTNAGKSTIMNRLLEEFDQDAAKMVLEQDMLFATLETTVRKISIENSKDFLLSDTVGFIHKLPHTLIKAFRSTLEEISNADLILHVVDCSSEYYKQQEQVTIETLAELGAGDIPILTVYNKADKTMDQLPKIQGDDKIYLSAKDRRGLKELVSMITNKVYGDHVNIELMIPYDKGQITSYFLEKKSVLEREYLEIGERLLVRCSREDAARYSSYRLL